MNPGRRPVKRAVFLWREIKTKKTVICVDMWEVIGYLYDQASGEPHNPFALWLNKFGLDSVFPVPILCKNATSNPWLNRQNVNGNYLTQLENQ